MATATVPNAGTFDLKVDTGFTLDGFTLDSTLRGILNNTDYVLNGTTTFASITTGVLSATVRRGRADPDDPFPAGTMSFVLNDSLADGVFSPFDNASPYYNDIANYPGLAPGREVQLIRYNASNVAEYLFVGQIINYEYSYALNGNDTVTVFCADKLARLANTFLTAHNPSKEFTGTRVAAILDRAEVNYPTGAARQIAAGTVELGGGSTYAIEEGTSVKQYFDEITDTAERGRIYIDRAGVLVSENRIGYALSTASVTFCDNPTHTTHARYNDLGITFKAEDIVNRAAVTPKGGTQQVATDATSQTAYGVRGVAISGSLLHDNTAAATLATFLLYPNAKSRFNQVQVQYARLTSTLKDACAILDVGDTIIITKQVLVNNVLTDRSQELAIEGLEHRVTFDRGMASRYFTSPTTVVYALILDDAVYGILDTNVVT